MAIKIKTFSSYKLIDVKDFYKKVYKHLIDNGLTFCFLEDGRLISREDCQKYITE